MTMTFFTFSMYTVTRCTVTRIMNFTHLLPPGSEISQELLDKFDHYMVVTVLDDEMEKLVMEIGGLKMQWSKTTLCQIVRPIDFNIALPGTMLDQIKNVLRRDPCAPSGYDYSFVACTSRAEILSHPPSGGIYIPMFLKTLEPQAKREVLSASLYQALSRPERLLGDETIRSQLKVVSSAASLVASLFRIKLGL